jgi:exopolysaccharide production protein ExoQ
MPPQIALLLCTLFIFYVLLLDYRQKPNVSSALWIPLIWLMIIGSRPVSHWLNPESVMTSSAQVEAGSPIDRLIFSVLILSGMFILSKRRAKCIQLLRNNKWILLWFLYCGISILWSDFPGVAFKRWIKGLGTVVMVFVVLTEPDPIESVKIKTLIRRCAYVLIPISVLFIKYYRNLGVAYDPWEGGPTFMGVTDDKNALGRLCLGSGIIFFYIVIAWLNKKESLKKKQILVNILFLLTILWLLIKSQSATSLVTFIIGSCIFVGIGLPIIKKKIKYIGIFIFLFILVLFILQQSFNITEIVVTNLGRNMTFTDRTKLWEDLLTMDTSPIFGTGYDSFWLGNRLDRLWHKYWWKPNESHNGYLEIYLELGLVGLSLLMGIFVNIYRKIRRSLMYDFDYGRLRIVFFIIILLYNITESAFKGIGLMWFIFLLISLDYERRPISEKSIVMCADG